MNPKIIFEKNNTEGHHTTAFKFVDTELRKDNKAVATDLPDLYDVNLTSLTDEDVLTFQTGSDWTNKQMGGTGTGCTVISPDTTKIINPGADFDSVQDFFDWLNECRVIDYDVVITGDVQAINVNNQKGIINYEFGDHVKLNFHNVSTSTIMQHIGEYPIEIKTGKSSSSEPYVIYITNEKNIYLSKVSPHIDFRKINDSDSIKKILFSKRRDALLLKDNNDAVSFRYQDSSNTLTFQMSNVKEGATYEKNYILIKNDGTLWVKGPNLNGELGINDCHNIGSYTQVGSYTDWKKVVCSRYFSVAIRENGKLYVTGDNSYGQLGISSSSVCFWEEVSLPFLVSDIACNNDSTVCITNNNEMYATGKGPWNGPHGSDYTVFTKLDKDVTWNNINCDAGIYTAMDINRNLYGISSFTNYIFLQEPLKKQWLYNSGDGINHISIDKHGRIFSISLQSNDVIEITQVNPLRFEDTEVLSIFGNNSLKEINFNSCSLQVIFDDNIYPNISVNPPSSYDVMIHTYSRHSILNIDKKSTIKYIKINDVSGCHCVVFYNNSNHYTNGLYHTPIYLEIDNNIFIAAHMKVHLIRIEDMSVLENLEAPYLSPYYVHADETSNCGFS